MDPSRYINACHRSEKYHQGRWTVLESDEVILSALIVYESGFQLPARSVGIGSIATCVDHRNQGYGSRLIQWTLSRLEKDRFESVYLFTDIGAEFYQRFGFEVIKESKHCGAMARSLTGSNADFFSKVQYF